jgi:hypothetical protein
MKQANLSSLQGNGTWNTNQGKLMYAFHVQLSDGVAGECNSISETPPYKVGDNVWYEVKGQSPKGTPRLKVSTSPPFQGTAQSQPTNRSEDIKRIEASWAINSSILALGILKGDREPYLNAVESMARELLNRRDSIVKTPYNEPIASSSTRWSNEDMNRAEAAKEVELPEPTTNDLPF